MEENKIDKKFKKRIPRRIQPSTESSRKRFIFEAFCIALSQENWKGAAMLMTLHEMKGKLEKFSPHLAMFMTKDGE
jgi:hypothetical protein